VVRKRRTQEKTEDDFEEGPMEAIEQDTELQATEKAEEDIGPETTDMIGEDELDLDLDLDLNSNSTSDNGTIELEKSLVDAEGDDDSLDLTDELDLGEDLDDDNKLDLARAYIDMGDSNGARRLLEEVLKVGTEAEIVEANELLEKIS